MVAVELEVLAKKLDRFGWERDRGTMAHDRIVSDWMDCLCDFPLSEVKAACRSWVMQNPRKMPNEGDIKALIVAERARMVAKPPRPSEPEREPRVTKAAAAEIMAQFDYSVKRVGEKS